MILNLALLCLTVAAEPGGPTRVEDVFAWLQGGKETQPSSIELSQDELNKFLGRAAEEGRLGPVRAISARFLEGDVEVVAAVDPEEINLASNQSLQEMMRSLFAGPQQVRILGSLSSESGTGRFEAKEVQLNGLTLPPSALSLLIQSLGKRLDPPLEGAETFALPFDLDRIEVLPGRVRLSR